MQNDSVNGNRSIGLEAATGPRTGMADSLMQEILRGLARLAETGEVGAIDLRSLPLTPVDRTELEERLGIGEVSASLDTIGGSELWETGYAGVWWVRHKGGGGQIAAETIEITPVPDILASHPNDIARAAARLGQELSEREEKAHV